MDETILNMTPQLFLLNFIATGIIYTVPVILFRKFTNERNKADDEFVAFVAALFYGFILSSVINSIISGTPTVDNPPIIWVLVCAYILHSESPFFSTKQKPNNTPPEPENILIEEDGTIIIEQQTPVEKQKYRTKKKLKILVALLVILLLFSVALNIYMIYEPDKYVFCAGKYYHDEDCSKAERLFTAMPKSMAKERGYKPCPICDP